MSTRVRIPAYGLHKASGQARVILGGQHVYLGVYGSPESHETYARLIAERAREVQADPGPPTATFGMRQTLTIAELILAYWRFATTYYVRDGHPTSEVAAIRDALRPMRKLYGRTLASEFGPKSLAAVRQHMIASQALCRNEVNKRIGRIKRVFKWGVAEELIHPSVFHGLQTIVGLRFGRSAARESEPVRPVADKDVETVLPYLSPPVRTMVQLQRLTGMRPAEVISMRGKDVDRSQSVWEYEPATHKNKWRGHRRLIPLGPRAQALLAIFLNRSPEEFLFSPRDADQWRIAQQAANAGKTRKTRVFPSELKSRQKRKAARQPCRRRRPPGERYDVAAYRRAITYGIQRAKKDGLDVNQWSPNQLRHSKATELRRRHGLEAAQVVLGHARANVTEVYAERNQALARELAQESG